MAVLLAFATLGGTASAAPASWTFSRTPHATPGLTQVSCPAARSCLALTEGDPEHVLQWNGRRWTVQSTSPRFAGSLDCPTTTMCVAVGLAGDRASADTWNGAEWTPSTVPGPGGYSELDGVSCVSATWCMAAGRGSRDAFFERFDGSKWTLVAAPMSLHGNAMYDVSCTSETHCVAVGVTFSCRTCHMATTRAETWDGEQWTATHAPPNLPGGANVLLHVSCGAPDRCLAVGQHDEGASNDPLVEQWNGHRWKLLTDPVPPGAMGSHVDDVSCAHGVNCVAVGTWYGPNGSGTFGQLIAAWNGTVWSYPDVEVHPSGWLHGVDCFDVRHCVAVGTDDRPNDRPLAFVGAPSTS
ncbi:MAG TPA: hypothetical protein VH914_06765 [Acidimicrobiia bacterium]|nr:hypothetical protein [Acidimicrobiia bacterium]